MHNSLILYVLLCIRHRKIMRNSMSVPLWCTDLFPFCLQLRKYFFILNTIANNNELLWFVVTIFSENSFYERIHIPLLASASSHLFCILFFKSALSLQRTKHVNRINIRIYIAIQTMTSLLFTGIE